MIINLQRIKKILLATFILLVGAVSYAQKEVSTKDTYLEQKPPEGVAQLFAPGIVSTGLDEFTISFTPDGKECFWFVLFNGISTILTSKWENDHWTSPEVAFFSGKYNDSWPAMQPDGKRLFFYSRRPPPGNEEPSRVNNIWFIEKINDQWSAPQPVGSPINGNEDAVCPSVTKDGTLYFSKKFPDGSSKICRSRLIEGKYSEPEILPERINLVKANVHSYIAPDESYLIIPLAGRPDLIGGGLNNYVSFRSKDDNWSEVINIGKSVNSDKCAGAFSISADGKYFFFQAKTPVTLIPNLEKKYSLQELLERQNKMPGGRNNDIYWIETKVIEDIRPQH